MRNVFLYAAGIGFLTLAKAKHVLRGYPNRVRPYRYREIFEAHGWTDVSITPLEQLANRHNGFAVDEQFKDARNQLEFLPVVICATKA
jgi:hypothetical protein